MNQFPPLNFKSFIRFSGPAYGVKDLKWHPIGAFCYYLKETGGDHGHIKNNLYKIRMDKSQELILQSYDSKIYGYLSCSNDGNKLLIERDDAVYEHPILKIKSSICLVDAVTLQETLLKIE